MTSKYVSRWRQNLSYSYYMILLLMTSKVRPMGIMKSYFKNNVVLYLGRWPSNGPIYFFGHGFQYISVYGEENDQDLGTDMCSVFPGIIYCQLEEVHMWLLTWRLEYNIEWILIQWQEKCKILFHQQTGYIRRLASWWTTDCTHGGMAYRTILK